ncbi:MAG: FAD-dependent monooxygenase [Steroidobacteraceae bacterium]
MQTMEVTLLGAGIAGLSAALGLQRAGFKVRIYEQAPELGEVGAGLSLSPTAAHALTYLGLKPMLEEKAYKPDDQAVRHYKDGRVLQRVNRGKALLDAYGERYYVIHRADLHGALAEAVRANDPEAILVNRRCVSVTQRGRIVEVGFADGETINADVLIGADGSRSVVRTCLFGESSPVYTGYIAWRGLVPMDRVPPDILDPPSGLFIGPRHMVNRYPVRNGTLLNFVAFAEREAWTAEGWSIHSTVAELLREFEGWHSDVLTFMAATPPDQLFKWGMFDHEPFEHWYRGRVGLLGDAAHPILPFLGHGAVLGIEDGVVLARAFQAAESPEEALQRFQDARIERASHVVRESRKAGKEFHAADPESYPERARNRAADEGRGLFAYNPVTQPV